MSYAGLRAFAILSDLGENPLKNREPSTYKVSYIRYPEVVLSRDMPVDGRGVIIEVVYIYALDGRSADIKPWVIARQDLRPVSRDVG